MKGSVNKSIIWLQASLGYRITTENRQILKGIGWLFSGIWVAFFRDLGGFFSGIWVAFFRDLGAFFRDSSNLQPKRFVSEMYLIVKFKTILLASKDKFLFPTEEVATYWHLHLQNIHKTAQPYHSCG